MHVKILLMCLKFQVIMYSKVYLQLFFSGISMKGICVPLILVVFVLVVFDVVVVAPLLLLLMMITMIILYIKVNKVVITLRIFQEDQKKAPKSSQSWTQAKMTYHFKFPTVLLPDMQCPVLTVQYSGWVAESAWE